MKGRRALTRTQTKKGQAEDRKASDDPRCVFKIQVYQILLRVTVGWSGIRRF